MQALLLVDIQNDFVPGGALAVAGGDAVIAVANDLMPRYDHVIATQDWHPGDHLSFASQHPGRRVGDVVQVDGLDQMLWPDHCVQNTPGAALCGRLDDRAIDQVVRKGMDRSIDSYSGFFDNGHRKATGLTDVLRRRAVEMVDVVGLATDYCVRFTVLDALREGFEARLILPGCRGVNLQPGDVDRAVAQMRDAGACIVDDLTELGDAS